MKLTRSQFQFGILFLTCLLFLLSHGYQFTSSTGDTTSVKVGLILDVESSLGKMCSICISIAMDEFYQKSPHYKTRLELHTRNSKDAPTDAVFKAIELLKNLEVDVILGPQTSAQAAVVAELGTKSQVPILSFFSTSSSISRIQMPYFIRMAQKDTYQLEVIVSLIRKFRWKSVNLVYEDSGYANDVIHNMMDMLLGIGVSVSYKAVIYPKAEDLENKIASELEKLMAMQTRVFIVHMSYKLGPLFFRKVQDVGLMSEGNAWIVTEELTTFFSLMNYSVIDSLQGAIGVKTYVPKSDKLNDFRHKMIHTVIQESTTLDNLNTFCLKAYDTVWAVAMAAERLGPDAFLAPKIFKDKDDFSDMGISQSGPQMLEEILKSKFMGLSGEISFTDDELEPQIFHILNVIGQGERVVGFWLPGVGLSHTPHDSSNSVLRPIIWPGESTVLPRGWVVATNGEKLKVGYIVKEFFPELVTIDKERHVVGYCIDVFKAAMSPLVDEFPYDFVPFEYVDDEGENKHGDLFHELTLQNFHVVVGDVTITSTRSLLVDFSHPYTRGGLAMIVPTRYDRISSFSAIFKAFSVPVWCSCFAIFSLFVMVIWFLEHGPNPCADQLKQIPSIAWMLASAKIFSSDYPLKRISKCVFVVYTIACMVLFAGIYLQILPKILLENHQLIDVNMEDLIKNGASVGYRKNSYVELILKHKKFDEAQLKAYNSPEEYDEALRKGSNNGGVAAVFDQIPYVDIFLKKFCGKYRKVLLAPMYEFEGYGFGFVFPLGSPLVGAVSTELLGVLQREEIEHIEKKWLGNCAKPLEKISTDTLMFGDIWGVFVIIVLLIFLAIIVFVVIQFTSKYDHWILKSLRDFFEIAPGNIIQHAPSASDPTQDGQPEINLGQNRTSESIPVQNGVPGPNPSTSERVQDNVIQIAAEDDTFGSRSQVEQKSTSGDSVPPALFSVV